MRSVYRFVVVGLALASCTQNTLRGRNPTPATQKPPTGAPPLSPPEGDGSGLGSYVPPHIDPPPGATVVPPTVLTLPPGLTPQPTLPPTGTNFPPQNPNGFPPQTPIGGQTGTVNPPPQNGTPVAVPRSLWMNLDCAKENQTGINVNIGATPFNVSAYTTAFCARTVDVPGDAQPVDFYFVLDMTGSMQPVLDNVRNNILEFAATVSKKSGSARFGAVGFRSPGDERLPNIQPPKHFTESIGLTDAASFKNKLMAWRVQGGSQLEAGQSGIAEAATLLKNDAVQNPTRKNVLKTIFYVSDQLGIMRWTLPHRTDTDELTGILRDAKNTMPNLQFFYSATKVRNTTGHNNDPRFANTPYEQATEILNRSGLRGKGYNFPFTKEDFLNNLSKDIMPPPIQGEGRCYVSRATVTNTGNTLFGTVNFNSYSAALAASMSSGGFQYTRLTTLGMTNYDTFNANVSRCCVWKENPNTGCLRTYDSTFQFRLVP